MQHLLKSISDVEELSIELGDMAASSGDPVDRVHLHLAVSEESTWEANQDLRQAVAQKKRVASMKRSAGVVSLILVGLFLFWAVSKLTSPQPRPLFY